jgi:hypothetical protein
MRRDLQGNNLSQIVLGPFSGKGYVHLKVCGEFRTFRKQVWWGDNGARRVERQPPSVGFPNIGISCVIAAYVATGSRRHRSVI